MAAWGLEQAGALASRRVGGKWAEAMGAALLVLVMADVHLASRSTFALALCEPPLRIQSQSEFRQVLWEPEQGRTWYGPPATPFARAGLGVVNGYYGGLPSARAAVPAGSNGYRGEAFFADPTDGRVRGFTFTARRIEVLCETGTGGLLVVNQNWAPGLACGFPARGRRRPEHRRSDQRRRPSGDAARSCSGIPRPGLWWGCGLFLMGTPALLYWALRASGRGRPGSEAAPV